MADQHPTGNGRLTDKDLTEAYLRRTTPYAFHKSRQTGDHCEPQPAEPEPAAGVLAGKANRWDWTTVALWIFVAGGFVAFVFASYLIWAKCRGASPF